MCNLVLRYVISKQKETECHPVTEDNINELRQDIYSFRYDLMRDLKNSGLNIRNIEKDPVDGKFEIHDFVIFFHIHMISPKHF